MTEHFKLVWNYLRRGCNSSATKNNFRQSAIHWNRPRRFKRKLQKHRKTKKGNILLNHRNHNVGLREQRLIQLHCKSITSSTARVSGDWFDDAVFREILDIKNKKNIYVKRYIWKAFLGSKPHSACSSFIGQNK